MLVMIYYTVLGYQWLQHNMLKYSKDINGDDILLEVCEKGVSQVMMAWEKPYMEACINKLKPKGHVLEVGFGMGYSATQIQKYNPKSYTIIECNQTVLKKCKEWAKKYDNVTIIESTWQEAVTTKKLKVYDEIFFDDQPLIENEGMSQDSGRMKLFMQLLTEYKNVKNGTKMSGYLCADSTDERHTQLKNFYSSVKSFSNPGEWIWESENFKVNVSNITTYHESKNSAIIPLMTFKKPDNSYIFIR